MLPSCGVPRRGVRGAARVGMAMISVAPLLVACGSPAAGPASAPRAAAERDQASVVPIHAARYLPPAVTEVVDRARQRLLSACMARRGFRYQADTPFVADEAGRPRPFGLETTDVSVRSETAGLVVSRPGNGCIAEAERQLEGDLRRSSTLRLRLDEADAAAIRRPH